MTGSQKIFLGIGGVVIIGLSLLIYQQMMRSDVPIESTENNVLLQEKSVIEEKPSPVIAVPSTPDAITNDILKEVETDNSTLNEEELETTSAIEAEASVVSDFETVYDANEN